LRERQNGDYVSLEDFNNFIQNGYNVLVKDFSGLQGNLYGLQDNFNNSPIPTTNFTFGWMLSGSSGGMLQMLHWRLVWHTALPKSLGVA